MKRWLLGSVFGLIIGVVIALSLGAFASSKVEMRSVTLTVSELPVNVTVEVWGEGNKYASFPSTQTKEQIEVPKTLDLIKLKLEKFPAPGVRYVTEQQEYEITNLDEIQVGFKKQYALAAGVSLTGGTFGGSEDVLEKMKYSPSSEDGFYDVGTKVIVTAPSGNGILFGHWVIKNNDTNNVSTDIREYSSATNPLEITINNPTYLFGRFVGEWTKLPTDGNIKDAIIVKNVVKGQKVIMIQNDRLIEEKIGEKIGEKIEGKIAEKIAEEINGPVVSLPIEEGKILNNVQFIITAPDGETIVYKSSIYDSIQAGNQFFY
jgi:hypothetical protein